MQTRAMLAEYESKKILEEYDIPVTRCEIAKTKEGSLRVARQIGYPVVMKIVSSDIVHKTEAGGVKLALLTEHDVVRAFTEVMEAARKYKPEARIDGVSLQKFIDHGVEVIVGVKRDPTFGPTIAFGLGGIFVELLKDVSLRVVPLTEQDITEMIAEVRGYQILQGFRSGRKSDVKSLVDLIKKVAELASHDDRILEMDLNPIIVGEEGKGAVVVDARILMR